jgi:UDP-GlcNAc:undecaprenyl-phosphate GlcNAc-1-phosphate transferase
MLKQSALLYMTIFAFSLGIASFSVPFLKKLALRLNMIDKPNQQHKTHQEPVPYLGGFAIVVPVVSLSIFGSFFLDGIYSVYKIILLLLPSLMISIVGFLDDFKNLPAKPRFIVQIATSIVVSILLIESGFSSKITKYEILNFLISTFWIVGITNALNFIDNLDGGAAGISFIASLNIFILGVVEEQYLIAMFSICIAGAAIGFLFWNFNPARIYLGDGGALFIGVMLSILLLQFEPSSNRFVASAAIPILILAVPIIDTSVVVTSRIGRGVPIFQGGRDHLSHRLQKIGFSRKSAALILWFISGTLSILGFLINYLPSNFELYCSLIGLGMMLITYLVFLFLPFERL